MNGGKGNICLPCQAVKVNILLRRNSEPLKKGCWMGGKSAPARVPIRKTKPACAIRYHTHKQEFGHRQLVLIASCTARFGVARSRACRRFPLLKGGLRSRPQPTHRTTVSTPTISCLTPSSGSLICRPAVLA
jgi:hypothetical protein